VRAIPSQSGFRTAAQECGYGEDIRPRSREWDHFMVPRPDKALTPPLTSRPDRRSAHIGCLMHIGGDASGREVGFKHPIMVQQVAGPREVSCSLGFDAMGLGLLSIGGRGPAERRGENATEGSDLSSYS